MRASHLRTVLRETDSARNSGGETTLRVWLCDWSDCPDLPARISPLSVLVRRSGDSKLWNCLDIVIWISFIPSGQIVHSKSHLENSWSLYCHIDKDYQ